MLDYNYIDKGCKVADHFHKPFNVTMNGAVIANGIDVTYPNGHIELRIFNYDPRFKSAIDDMFSSIVGVQEVTFSNPLIISPRG
jgi:hypothetical protein